MADGAEDAADGGVGAFRVPHDEPESVFGTGGQTAR